MGEYQNAVGSQIQQLEVEQRQLVDELSKLKGQMNKLTARKFTIDTMLPPLKRAYRELVNPNAENQIPSEKEDDTLQIGYCTEQECLAPTDKYYVVLNEDQEQINFGLCLECAGEILDDAPHANWVVVEDNDNLRKQRDHKEETK